MENRTENVDADEVIDSNIIDTKQSHFAIKRDLMKTPSQIIYVKVILIAKN